MVPATSIMPYIENVICYAKNIWQVFADFIDFLWSMSPAGHNDIYQASIFNFSNSINCKYTEKTMN